MRLKRIQLIRSWFSEELFRRLLVNTGWLLGATVIASLIKFINVIIAARYLGPEQFGIFVTVILYVEIVGIFFTFKSWQAIVKYGSEVKGEEANIAMKQLLKFGFLLDGSTSVVGTVVAIVGAGLIGNLLGWDPRIVTLAVIYSWTNLFNIVETPGGVLRLFNRFDLLSMATIVAPTLNLVAIAYASLTNQNLDVYIWIYAVSAVIGKLFLTGLGLHELHNQKIHGWMHASLKGLGAQFSGIWDYVWATNLNSTLRLISIKLDVLVVGAIVGPTEAGVFQIAKQFARVLPLLIEPLYQSIYPELADLWAKNDKVSFSVIIRRTTFLVGITAILGWFGFLLLGQWLIDLAVGNDYKAAYLFTAVYMIGFVIATLSFSFQPAMLAIGLARESFWALLISTVIYLASLVLLVSQIGVIGAAIAFVVFIIVWSSIMFQYLRPYLIVSRSHS